MASTIKLAVLSAVLSQTNALCPAELRNYGCKCDYVKNGRRVDCSNRNLYEIPPGIPSDVQFLDLSQNHLSQLGEGLAPFTDLLRLNVSFNEIVGVNQANFDMLKKMEYLDLAFNSLAGPNAVETGLLNQNPALLHAYFSHSRITYLPTLFGQQNSAVRVLGFDHNLIETIPDDFFQYIPGVKAVTFRFNLFSNWPVGICNLDFVELLDMAQQNFTSIAFPASCNPYKSVNRLDLYRVVFHECHI